MKQPLTLRELYDMDQQLAVGTTVTVRWGYGLGFRAEGRGVIAKVNAKSVQVTLSEPVSIGAGTPWPAGFTLKGIPRFGLLNASWNHWNCVEVIA